MEAARALMDSLMGPSRDNPEDNERTDGWKENNVCKRYLVGFCPNNERDNWFHNTRRKDLNCCTKIHSDRLKEDFEKHPDHAKYEARYDKDFLDFLEGLVREADAWIKRENGNAKVGEKMTKMPAGVKKQVEELKDQQEQLMKLAEEFAEKDDLEGSKQAVESAKKAAREIDDLKEKHTFMSEADKVCNVCGVRCNPNLESDFNAHLDGRLHEGYTTIRAKVKEIRLKLETNERLAACGLEKDKKKDSKEADNKSSNARALASGDALSHRNCPTSSTALIETRSNTAMMDFIAPAFANELALVDELTMEVMEEANQLENDELKEAQAKARGSVAAARRRKQERELPRDMRQLSASQAQARLARLQNEGKFTTCNHRGLGTWQPGEFKAGRKRGQGTMTYSDGGEFIGEFRDGSVHGYGIMTYTDGDVYEGEWKKGLRHGEGEMRRVGGGKYFGAWKCGLVHGYGTEIRTDGTEYFGAWKESFRHGEGTLVFADGGEYVGQFKKGVMHGRGMYISPDGRHTSAEWKQGIEQGPAIVQALLQEYRLKEFVKPVLDTGVYAPFDMLELDADDLEDMGMCTIHVDKFKDLCDELEKELELQQQQELDDLPIDKATKRAKKAVKRPTTAPVSQTLKGKPQNSSGKPKISVHTPNSRGLIKPKTPLLAAAAV